MDTYGIIEKIGKDKIMDKKKIFWAVASFFIAVLSIWAVVSQNKSFSLDVLLEFIKSAKKEWLAAGFLCMFGFIWFEGLALVRIANHFGYKTNAAKGTVYGGADVYFSAITPSASGGQPASAYFMMKDGIPGTVTMVRSLSIWLCIRWRCYFLEYYLFCLNFI